MNAGNELLIGPKTWDRIMEIFRHLWTAVSVCMDCYGSFCDNLFNKLCFGNYKTGNGNGNRFHQEEPT